MAYKSHHRPTTTDVLLFPQIGWEEDLLLKIYGQKLSVYSVSKRQRHASNCSQIGGVLHQCEGSAYRKRCAHQENWLYSRLNQKSLLNNLYGAHGYHLSPRNVLPSIQFISPKNIPILPSPTTHVAYYTRHVYRCVNFNFSTVV